jgi:predicted DNA-binding helix-hairpin-helix protein
MPLQVMKYLLFDSDTPIYFKLSCVRCPILRASMIFFARVPGIGVTSAKKIIEARKIGHLTHDNLRYMGVSLSKSKYFITCKGIYYGGGMLGNPHLRTKLWADEFVFSNGMEQISMFNDNIPIDYDVST